jgi:two-component system LytT family sensor kinase
MHPSWSAPARWWTAALLTWLVLVVVFSAQDYAAWRWFGQGSSAGPLLLHQVVVWCAWAVLLPAIVAFVRRRPVTVRDIPAHAAFGIALALLHTLIVAAIFPLFYYAPSMAALRDVFRGGLTSYLGVDLLVYVALVAGVRASEAAREAQVRELAQAELSARAANAELALLYGQLQPHFLFNALNSIVELVDADPDRATTMLRHLSVLLRRALASVQTPLTTVGEEIAFVERYVALQQMRFPQLVSTIHCDPGIAREEMPSMVLQPLVENAIRYASSVQRDGGGHVTVSALRMTGGVRFTVTDDGPGLDAGSELAGAGIGLANVRARLQHVFGDAFALSLAVSGTGTGTVVTLDLPNGRTVRTA